MNSKVCQQCRTDQPIDQYAKDKSRPSGYAYRCKGCMSLNGKRHRLENRESYLASRQKWRDTHPEAYKAYRNAKQARLRAKHPDKIAAANKRWREANKDKIRDLNRAYVAANRDKVALYGQIRHWARRANGGDFTVEQWVDLCERFGNECVGCGEQHPLTVDHIIPISKGGDSDISNIQPLCQSCNASKGNRIIIDYRLPWKKVDMLRAG